MRILRPNGRKRLDEQVLEGLRGPDGTQPRTILLLAPGDVRPALLEPFATIDDVVGETFAHELRVVATDTWPEQFWESEVNGVLELGDSETDTDFRPTEDQRRRALAQRIDDGSLEALFIERGRIVGSALTLVARRRVDGQPLALNHKLTAMDLLATARDAFHANPRPLSRLIDDARSALGIPAGSVTSIAAVRRARGETVRALEDSVPLDRIGDAMARPGVSVVTSSVRRPTPRVPAPTRTPSNPVVSAPPAVVAKSVNHEDRHVVLKGVCERCGKKGKGLEEACGRPELGRIGVIELD